MREEKNARQSRSDFSFAGSHIHDLPRVRWIGNQMAPLSRVLALLLSVLIFPCGAASAFDELPRRDQIALMAQAKHRGTTGIARKTREVDARPASPGEIVITFIKGQGVETRSKPAEIGDWVVRNRCEETGNEESLVKARVFRDRYGEPLTAQDAAGYRAFKPDGPEMTYFIVTEAAGPFNFKAPSGDTAVALPGDAIVQLQTDEGETFGVAQATFACTYEIVEPARTIIDAAMR